MPQPTSRHRLPPRHCCAPPGTARWPSGCPRSASDAATRPHHRRTRARQPPTPLRRLHGGLPSEYSDSFGRASTARSEPAVTPPSEHSDSSSRHLRPPCHRCATQDAARRPSGCPRPVVDVSCPLRARRRALPYRCYFRRLCYGQVDLHRARPRVFGQPTGYVRSMPHRPRS